MLVNTEPSAYKRLQSTRDQIATTLNQKGVGAMTYTGSSGGSFQSLTQNSMASEEQQYIAAMRGWQFSAVKLIAIACANQAIRVGVQRDRKRSKKTKDFSFEGAPTHIKAISEQLDVINVHEVIDLVETPNAFPAGTEYGLKFCTAFSLNVTGRAFWYIEKDASGKESIFYLPSTWVFPRFQKDTGKQIGWTVKRPDQMEGLPVPLLSVMPFVIPNPSHPAEALSFLQTQAPAVNTDEQITTAQYRAMVQGIFPSLALHVGREKSPLGNSEYTPTLSPEQRKQMIDTVMTAASGAVRYGLPFIIDGMIEKISPVTNKPADMDFMDGAKAMRERIFLAYGVNPIVAGLVEGANRASSFVAHEQFYRTVVNPNLTLMGQTLTKYMAPRYANGKRLYIWFEEAAPYDSDADRRNKRDLATFGGITINEYRESFGLSPVPGGEKLIEPRQAAAAGVGRPNST